MFVDYALGQPGSVHDAYAFQGTRMVQNPAGIVPPQHWIWADSAYISKPTLPCTELTEGCTESQTLKKGTHYCRTL